MTKLAKQISIQKNLFTYNNTLFEKLYNHPQNIKYRFFFDEDYDYVESVELINKLNKITN